MKFKLMPSAEGVDALRALTDTTYSQDLRRRLIEGAITAAWDRLNLAKICRPHLADMEPRELDVLCAELRRLIGQRKEEAAKARAGARSGA